MRKTPKVSQTKIDVPLPVVLRRQLSQLARIENRKLAAMARQLILEALEHRRNAAAAA